MAKQQPQIDADLFTGLKRGHGQIPTPAHEHFPTASQTINEPKLRFDLAGGNKDGKILLGVVGAKMRQASNGFPYASGGHLIGVADDRHVVTVAGSRSGKGRSLLINNLLTWPGSVLVLDPKLDLATDTARYRAEVLGQKVHVLDPFGAASENCEPYQDSFNPLDLRLGDDADASIELAMLIAESLVIRTGKELDPHWNDAAKQMIEAVVLHVLTWPDFEGRRTLKTAHSLLMSDAEGSGDKPGELETAMIANTAFDGVIIEGANAFYDKAERERSSVLSNLRRHLHFLMYPKICRVLESGGVDLAGLQNTPMTIYAGVPASKMGSCAGWLRLFINLSLATFEVSANRRDYQYQSGRLPVLILMDEFSSLSRMERVEAAAGQLAGLGAKLWAVLQDLSQLKETTPKWETFLGNAGLLTFFGNTDLSTLDWIEKRLGPTSVYTPSQSDVTYDAAVAGGATGTAYSLSTSPLMSGPEIARTFAREDPFARALAILPRTPLIYQRAYYDLHEDLRRLHGQSQG